MIKLTLSYLGSKLQNDEKIPNWTLLFNSLESYYYIVSVAIIEASWYFFFFTILKIIFANEEGEAKRSQGRTPTTMCYITFCIQ